MPEDIYIINHKNIGNIEVQGGDEVIKKSIESRRQRNTNMCNRRISVRKTGKERSMNPAHKAGECLR